MARNRLAHLLALVVFASCASTDSARYLQVRETQANLNNRAAEALDAGLIDTAMAKRVLAISEAVSEQAAKYRAALAEGSRRSVARMILEGMERLLERAELFLPAAEILQ